MDISENQVIDELVSRGLIHQDAAEIIQNIVVNKAIALDPLDGATIRAVVMLIDKSGSMEPLANAVIDGQNRFINAILGANSATPMYLGQILFNHEVEFFQNIAPFRDPVNVHKTHSDIRLLDENTYIAEGGTSLYDTIIHGFSMLAPVLLMAEETGQQVLADLVVITDGKDEHSKTSQIELKKVLDFVLDNGIINNITLAGIGNYDYKTVGRSIGLEDVIESNATESDIREIFGILSDKALHGSN